MANSYFSFKQFTIHQDRCAMKVCTDSCIFGAWFAAKIPDHALVLDIGSGTGLLLLMIAQQSQARLEGIEIDREAYAQLKENIAASTWSNRIRLVPGDVRHFVFHHKFDFIICNPPFYENELAATRENEQIARHSRKLVLAELVAAFDANLGPGGAFGVLLPPHREAAFDALARAKGFHCIEKLWIKQTPRHSAFRVILHYHRSQENFVPDFELTITDENGRYTEAFIELMKPYYLNL